VTAQTFGWALIGVAVAWFMVASTWRCKKCDRVGNMFWGALHLCRRERHR
jgi:hypothetical protein